MEWTNRIRLAFGPQPPDADIVEELAQHAEATYAALRADGASEAEATARVEAEIAAWAADPTVLRRPVHRRPAIVPPAPTRGALGLVQDLRYAARLLRRQPAYAAIVILTMALGIAATTVLGSIAYGVLLKPLPWANAGRLVRLYESRQGGTPRFQPMMTNASYLAWRQPSPATLDAIGAWRGRNLTLTGLGEPQQLKVAGMTPGLFDVLGAVPLLGRTFAAGEEDPGRPGIVIISYGLWQQEFGSRTDVLGQRLRLDGTAFTIVGVMPASFAFPDRETRAWQPLYIPPVTEPNTPGHNLSLFQAVGRLRDGVTPEQAAAEGTARGRSVPDPGPVAMLVFGSNGPVEVTAIPFLQALTGKVRDAILIMLAAVILLLATATANVASLQLVRGTARRREYAIRAALGAGSGRLFRQSLLESALLGLLGGLVALVLAGWIHRVLPSLLPADFPRLADISFDRRIQGLAMLLSAGAGLAFGLLPALHTTRRDVVPVLVEDSLAPIGGSMRAPLARARASIMAGQVAIACVLLVGGLLLLRSFTGLMNAPLGYEPTNLLTARIILPDSDFRPEGRLQVLEQIATELRATPGVTAAAYSTAVPFTPDMSVSSSPLKRRDGSTVQIQYGSPAISAGYFAALGQRLAEGREFTSRDTATSQPVVVVNREFARRYLDGNALGWSVPGRTEAAPWQIVGVVEDTVRQSVTDTSAPEIYLPATQELPSASAESAILIVRTTTDPRALVSIVRSAVRRAAPAAPIDSIHTMDDLVSGSLAQPRLYALLLGAFAAFALAIAGVGLLGVLSYSVALRAREIAIRAALGAAPRDLVTLVVGQCVQIAGAGIVAGLVLSAWLSRSLGGLLYGITAHDATSFFVVAALLLAVAALAAFVPARRAARVDPVRVLRG
jgi:putative ABC transport system permease protein